MASHSRSASSRGVFSTWNARRWAPLAPMPGSFCSCSTNRVRESGRDIKSQIPKPKSQIPTPRSWELEVGSWELDIGNSSETGNLETAHQPGHRLPELFVDLAIGVVDGGHDQILQHLDIVLRHDFGIDGDRLQLFGAVDDDRDHAAAGGRFDAQLGHLLLQALLHLLGLLHHGLDIHRATSPRRRGSRRETRRAPPAPWTTTSLRP